MTGSSSSEEHPEKVRITFTGSQLSGELQECGPIPGSVFLNGFTPGPRGTGYAVDSIVGAVIAIDLDGGSSQIVLKDDRLQKISAEPMLPGVNGIKAGDGALYLTNTDRALAIAGPEQGMAGCTACTFGTSPDQRESLFVTTTGGIVMPLDGVVQEAKLVRLDVATAGRPVAFFDAAEQQ